MKKLSLSFTLLLFVVIGYSQNYKADKVKIKEDLYQILNDISLYYAYQQDKTVDLKCLLNYYEKQIDQINSEDESVLFFDYLLDEYYDSHLILNTNRNSSFR